MICLTTRAAGKSRCLVEKAGAWCLVLGAWLSRKWEIGGGQ